MKRNVIILIVFFIFFTGKTFATHQRAAEITFRYISGLTYEFTLVTYTYTPSPADRPEIVLYWGDASYTNVSRIEKINLPNDLSKNVYISQHTFPAPGNYIIYMLDPNRNAGVINIPNSVNIPMYVETELIINPFIGNNNSPLLLNPPIDRACVGQPFMHNPGAYDIDGDSLSYRLIYCKGIDGIDIPGYSYPHGNVFNINPYTGDLLWDSPQMEGEYNIAIIIEEWRKGIKIGSVIRDMQVLVLACNNHPPLINVIIDTCLVAGKSLAFNVIATDIDVGDRLTLTATGGPLDLSNSPAEFSQPSYGIGSVSSMFSWQTTCLHVKRQAYQMFFKAIDNSSPVNLVAYKTVNIRVVGPSPKNLSANPLGNSIKLLWNRSECSNAVAYDIYRHNGYIGYIPGYCETGVPAYTGYEKVGSTLSILDTNFTDNNNGIGLIHGIDYCYMVVAIYPDGAESYASLEACTHLKKDVPVITNISIRNTDNNEGSVYIAWSMPSELDLTQTPGPFRYKIYRGEGYNLLNPILIDSLESITDTTYIDSSLNTKSQAISYRIDFLNSATGNYFYIGSTHIASSVFLSIIPTDNALKLSWTENVPWINNTFTIYRYNNTSLSFDFIANTTGHIYTDSGLVNNITYCYKIKSTGYYNSLGFVFPIENFSQISCSSPYDNVPPCAPNILLNTNCVDNLLTWNNLARGCAPDVMLYEIYFKANENNDFLLIHTSNSPSDTFFLHQNISNVVGCYTIVAVDSLNNRSEYSTILCVNSDSCPDYRLPNVFTPNNDNVNDFFTPYPYGNVEKIDIQIFNRWGALVFKTEDPDINWDGKDYISHKNCSGGVYYYICDVFIIRLNGIVKKTLSGTVQLIR